MPTILRQQGYRFFFYSKEGNEPVHVHVCRDDMLAKYWIKPVALAYNSGFKKNDLKKIKEIVFSNQTLIEEAWHEFFRQD